MSDGVTVDASAPLTFGGDVSTVLESPRANMASVDARGGSQRSRAGASRSREIVKQIEAAGHQVRLLPAGLRDRPRHGQGRRRLLSSRRSPRRATSSSTAPPPTSSTPSPATTSASARRSPSSPRSRTCPRSRSCPGTTRVARVFCDCYDTETGELLDADPRQNLKRVVAEFEEELGYQFLDRHRAGDDVAQEGRGGLRPRGRHQALLLPHPPVRGAPSGAPRRRRIRPGARPRHVLRRPRGRPRPARAELPLRPPRQDGRQHHHVPADLRRGGPQARPSPDLHAQAVHRRKPRVTGTTTTSPSSTTEGNNVFHDKSGPAELSDTRPVSSWAACWSTSAR